eukprot:3877427-Amphidinium_carterae.1
MAAATMPKGFVRTASMFDSCDNKAVVANSTTWHLLCQRRPGHHHHQYPSLGSHKHLLWAQTTTWVSQPCSMSTE